MYLDITSSVIAFAVNWVNMLGNFNYRRYHKDGYRDGYSDMISSKVLAFASKLIGIFDDFNYKRCQKRGGTNRMQGTTKLALVLIFIFILPACALIFTAFIIALILDSVFK